MPKKDFRRIRSQANLLVKRGNAIVKLDVPRGMSDDKKEEFSKQLDSFRQALNRFKSDAKSGADSQLITSYSAVHDKFEMLASMLPRKSYFSIERRHPDVRQALSCTNLMNLFDSIFAKQPPAKPGCVIRARKDHLR